MGRLSNKKLLLQNVDYAIGLFLIYALTLSIFPGFLSEDTGSHSLGTWYVFSHIKLSWHYGSESSYVGFSLTKFRYALVLIAAYNVFDLVGRYIPLIKCIKLESRKWLMVSILARILLVPAFYFTAKYGNQGWMILLTSFLGLTNGYLTVCLPTTAPKGYKVRLVK